MYSRVAGKPALVDRHQRAVELLHREAGADARPDIRLVGRGDAFGLAGVFRGVGLDDLGRGLGRGASCICGRCARGRHRRARDDAFRVRGGGGSATAQEEKGGQGYQDGGRRTEVLLIVSICG